MSSTTPLNKLTNREMIDDISSVMHELVSDVKELSTEAKELKEILLGLMNKSEPTKTPTTEKDDEAVHGWFWS